MQTITLVKKFSSATSKTVIAVNPQLFKLLTHVTPLHFTAMLIAKSLMSSQVKIDDIEKKGRAGAWGIVLPGAITFSPIPIYYDMQTDLTITCDVVKKNGSIGEYPFDQYHTTFCPTLVEAFDHVGGDSIAKYFDTDQERAKAYTGLALGFVLGIFDGLSIAKIDVLQSDVISLAVRVLGTFGMMDEYDGHDEHLRLSVVAGAVAEVMSCLTRRGGFIGNSAINPDYYVKGPQIQQFEDCVYGDVRQFGYAFGRIIDHEAPLLVGAALLQLRDRYELDPRTHETLSHMNFGSLTPHDKVRICKIVDQIDQLGDSISQKRAA